MHCGEIYAETLEHLVNLLEPSLSRIIRDRENATRVRDIAREISADAVRYFGFELPLGSDSGKVDVAMNLCGNGCERLRDSPEWPELRRIVEAACSWPKIDPQNTWLEWDTSTEHEVRQPSLYLTLDDLTSLDREDCDAIYAIAGRDADFLERCIAAKPPASRRLHIGFMFGRPSAGIRIGVSQLDPIGACAFLRDIGWNGHVHSVRRLLDMYADVCDGFSVQADCRGGDVQLVGFEVLFAGIPSAHQPSSEPRWAKLLQRLVEMRYATISEISTLLAWPSERKFRLPAMELAVASRYREGEERVLHGTLLTGLQHVKLTTSDARAVRAKAYFGAVFIDDR